MSKVTIIITGQTATGKTSLALELAEKHNGELINCDSRQIYKHLDIITGKDLTDKTFHPIHTVNNCDIGYYSLSNVNPDSIPIKSGSIGVKIWLYDIVDPKEYFSSYDYQKCALSVIQDVLSRGKTPIIVGGTYFYIKHLLYDIPTENISPDWSLRKELEKKSVSQLQDILKSKSTEFFSRLNQSDRNNPQRLIRKIEIISQSDSVVTKQYAPTNYLLSLANKLHVSAMDIKYIGLKYRLKDRLQQVIKKRVEERVRHGAVAEVEQLLKIGYTSSDPGMKTIGYQQIIQYLENKISKDEAISIWITKELQYAKRQYTFMKNDPNIVWKDL